MREVNFSIPNVNKASVGITTALYDRRALDCTSNLPLINSLNHLAYLTTSSARIRDILTVDGGIERLICILKQGRSTDVMAMWKWNLAFQCVVNIGVRGTETVRTRVVEADVVPVIATILENYIRLANKCQEKEEQKKRALPESLPMPSLPQQNLLNVNMGQHLHGQHHHSHTHTHSHNHTHTHSYSNRSRTEQRSSASSSRSRDPSVSASEAASAASAATAASLESWPSVAPASASAAVPAPALPNTSAPASNLTTVLTSTLASINDSRSPRRAALPPAIDVSGSYNGNARVFSNRQDIRNAIDAFLNRPPNMNPVVPRPNEDRQFERHLQRLPYTQAHLVNGLSTVSAQLPVASGQPRTGTIVRPERAMTAPGVGHRSIMQPLPSTATLEAREQAFGSQPVSPTTPLPLATTRNSLMSTATAPTATAAVAAATATASLPHMPIPITAAAWGANGIAPLPATNLATLVRQPGPRPTIRPQPSNTESENSSGNEGATEESADIIMTGTDDADMAASVTTTVATASVAAATATTATASTATVVPTAQPAIDIQEVNANMEHTELLGQEGIELTVTAPEVVSDNQDATAFNITHDPTGIQVAPVTGDPAPVNPRVARLPVTSQPNTAGSVPRFLADSRASVLNDPQMLAVIPRDEDVLMSLQLLAYVSKYCGLRTYFQKSHLVPKLRIGKEYLRFDDDPVEPSGSSLSETKSMKHNKHSDYDYKYEFDDECNNGEDCEEQEEYLLPDNMNIFPLVEKFTVRHHTTDMQYWAGVVMRNLCRKDDTRGGIRQCAYWRCGKWEEFTRQFAKCRRCRRTKYCSKDCQKNAWAFHRHWCVSASQ